MIIIELLKTDSDNNQNELMLFEQNGATIVESKAFEGEPDTIQILIEITKTVLPIVTAFIAGHYEGKKYIAIKHNGTEVSGLTKDNAMEVLERIMESDSAKLDVSKKKAEIRRDKAEAKKLKAEAENAKAGANKLNAEAEKIKSDIDCNE